MSKERIIYIILAGVLALIIAVYQYYYKNKKSMSKLNMLFSFLRFITIFSVLLLIVNPRFDQVTLSVEKPNLVVLADNSNSVRYLKQNRKVDSFIALIKSNKSLNEKFDVDIYAFGETLRVGDSLNFTDRKTNINDAFNQLSQIYKESVSPTILITDGNQTFGNDYEFAYSDYNQPIYSVVLGDSIFYTDLKIKGLNVNSYAYLKNNFPVEAILSYTGNNTVASKFEVTKSGQTVFSQAINFSKENNSKILNFNLPTSKVGVNSYKTALIPLPTEKNKVNNFKDFAIEVIDEKTKIAIVSGFHHPDLGLLKKSIESNEQQEASILTPTQALDQFYDFQLFLIYQPNRDFKKLFEILEKENKNKFVIVGPHTDLRFLNTTNNNYKLEITNQFEEYQAVFNDNFTPFIVSDIDFESFPPLKSVYGSVNFMTPFQSILNKSVRGINAEQPLLATFEVNSRREALLLGENIWKWRSQSYLNTKSFDDFDNFIGKLIQYLSSNDKKNSRLRLEYDSFYDGNKNIVFKAQYFDKTYAFDSRAIITIDLKNRLTGKEELLPFTLKNNNYQVDLSHIEAGDYDFKVNVENANFTKSGTFKVLSYNVEQQFLNANYKKLQRLSFNSQASSFFIDDSIELFNILLADKRYVQVQKSHKNTLPLIDWKFLLAIIVISLSAEWFLRKYNGLI